MTASLDNGTLVTVFGGSGFVGRNVVRLLAKRGCRIRAAERRPDLAGHLQPMGGVGQIHAIQANVRYGDSIHRAVAGADVVVNCVAILAETGRQTFDAVNVEGARRIARAAKAGGARALVHISAIGADPKSTSRYARSRALGEAAVLKEFPEAIILRLSLVFGQEDEFFNRFASLARLTPVMPMIGGPTRMQPVYVGDVAEAVVAAAAGLGKPGTIYEIGGPQVFTFREIMKKTMGFAERQRCLFPVPFWVAKFGAVVSKVAPMAIRPITLDQVRMLQHHNIVSDAAKKENRTLAGLGLGNGQAIDTIVPGYLERFRPHGQYAHYRG